MAYLRSTIGRITTSSIASDPVPGASALTAVASGAIVGGKGVVINSDGTVTQISGSAASTALSVQDEDTLKVFENADSQYDQNCKSAIDPNNKNKVVYTSREDSSSSGKAVARVGTISSGSAITFGAISPTYGTGGSGTRSNYIAFDPAQPGVFVVQFVDENNSRYGTGIVGTVASAGTGTTITWGSPVVFQSNYTSRDSSSAGGGLQFDTNTAGKFIIMYDHTLGNNNYELTARIGTISGTTLTFGASQPPWASFNDGKGEYPAYAVDPNAAGKFVLMWRDKTNSNYGTLIVGTCDYTASTISWGTPTVFESSDIETEYNRQTNAITFLPDTAGKFVIWYNKGNHIGYGRVCTYSGTTIASVGPAVSHTASWYGCDWIQAHNDPDKAGDCTIMWQSAPYDVGFMKQAHISGTAITFDGPTSTGGSENDGQKLFSVNDGSYGVQNLCFNYLADGTNRFVGSYYDHDAGQDVYTFMGSNGGPVSSNLTMENFIGFCDTAVNNAATATITSPGYVTTTQASLTPGQQYYVQYDGTLALTSDSTMSGNTLLVGKVLAGTALTANNLYVETSDPDPATKSINTSFTATGGETSVNIEYVPGQLSVYLNGIKLLDTTDYTAINGTSISLSSALAFDDVVDFVALSVFSVGDHVPASTGGIFIGEVTLPSPVINTGVSGSAILNSNTMAGTSATSLSTSQSIKSYVDASEHTPEGTAVKSTGESGAVKFLREDGDATSSWQTITALPSVYGSSGNLGVGATTLDSLTSGHNNVGAGDNALTSCTDGYQNTAIGSYAMENTTSANQNAAAGFCALRLNETGERNTAMGAKALRSAVTGDFNTAVGYYALYLTNGANWNTALGFDAGKSIVGGNTNTVLGAKAGDNITTGSSNIIIGYNIDADSATGSNQLNIGGAIKGNLSSGDITFTGHVLPSGDNSKDLGSAAKRWQNIYTTDLHLANERGNWTVIEEENYLTLRNNKTNKVYKLVMEEIE